MQGRPRPVIVHCLDRKSHANKYDDEDIHSTNEPGIFKIKKGEDFKHTVDFLKPSCTCKDWIHWHMPCKHFFAIFRAKPGWGWRALPQSYTDSPYLQSDAKAIQEYFNIDAKELTSSHDCEVFQGSELDESALDILGKVLACIHP